MAYTQQPGFQRRIEQPPPTGNAALDGWLQRAARVLNDMPRVSWFSGTHPNVSKITGTAGDMVVNLASASTNSRLWIMGGVVSNSTTTGWMLLSVTPVA